MANVAEVIDRHAADIHPNFPLTKGNEILLFARHGIMDAKAHESILKRNNGIMEWWNDDVMKTDSYLITHCSNIPSLQYSRILKKFPMPFLNA
jgi:hypothetical protein